MKKGTAEDAAKLAKGLFSNHDRISGALDLRNASSSIFHAGGQSGIDSMLGNVKDLLPEDHGLADKTKPAADAAEEDDDNDDQEAEEEKGKGRKRKAWFDRDREVNKAFKVLDGARSKVRTQATKLCTDWQFAQSDLGSLPDASQANLEVRIALVQPASRVWKPVWLQRVN